MFMIQKKQGYALLTSILACLFLGMFIGLSFMRSSSLSRRGVVSRNAEDALYAADSGLQYALSELRSSGINWTGTTGFQNIENNGTVYGSYQITINSTGIQEDPPWKLIPMTIIGRNAGQTASRQVNAVIRAQSPAAFFLSSISDLVAAPGGTVDGNVMGRNVTFGNATASQPINVNGVVQYFNNLYGYDPNNPSATPDIHISGNPATTQIDPVAFVGIDKARYQGLACTNNSGYCQQSGNLTISGTLDRQYNFAGSGTNAQNGVVYVNGNVYISATVAQSMVIVATGDIHVTGDVAYSDQTDPSIQLGLFAKGNIIVDSVAPGGNRTLQAMLISENRLFAQGGVSSLGTLNFKGAMAIKGQPNTTTTAIDLAPFLYRNYTYHSELFTNCTIPAMSYMADVETWSILGNPAAVADY